MYPLIKNDFTKFLTSDFVKNLVLEISKSTTYYNINDNKLILNSKKPSKLLLPILQETLDELNILEDKDSNSYESTNSYIRAFLKEKNIYLVKNASNKFVIQNCYTKGAIDISTNSGYLSDFYNYISVNTYLTGEKINEILHTSRIAIQDDNVIINDLYGSNLVTEIRAWFVMVITKVISMKLKKELNIFERLLLKMNLKYKFDIYLINKSDILNDFNELEQNCYEYLKPVFSSYEIEE